MHLNNYERHGHNIMRRFSVEATYKEFASQLEGVRRADQHEKFGIFFCKTRSEWFEKGLYVFSCSYHKFFFTLLCNRQAAINAEFLWSLVITLRKVSLGAEYEDDNTVSYVLILSLKHS